MSVVNEKTGVRTEVGYGVVITLEELAEQLGIDETVIDRTLREHRLRRICSVEGDMLQKAVAEKVIAYLSEHNEVQPKVNMAVLTPEIEKFREGTEEWISLDVAASVLGLSSEQLKGRLKGIWKFNTRNDMTEIAREDVDYILTYRSNLEPHGYVEQPWQGFNR